MLKCEVIKIGIVDHSVDLESLYDEFYPIISKDRNILTAKENHEATPKLIQEMLELYEIESDIYHFDFYGITGRNLWIPPPIVGKPYILIMAHHDTVPNCPGVDDNGSGMMIAYLLAIWYHKNKKLLLDTKDLNISFVFPDFEEGDPRNFLLFPNFIQEEGLKIDWSDLIEQENWIRFRDYLDQNMEGRSSFVGTRKFVEFLRDQQLLDLITIVINFETVGFTSRTQQPIPNVPIQLEQGNFLSIGINATARDWIHRITIHDHDLPVVSLPIPNKGQPIPDSRRSDHAVFWDLDINAMLCTDTANFRNPNYHMPTDTEIDKEFVLNIVDYFLSLLTI